jgi:hypothetical protein
VPLHSTGAAGRRLPVERLLAPLLEPIGREEAAIRHDGAVVLEVDDTAHARFELLADGVEQDGHRRTYICSRNGPP